MVPKLPDDAPLPPPLIEEGDGEVDAAPETEEKATETREEEEEEKTEDKVEPEKNEEEGEHKPEEEPAAAAVGSAVPSKAPSQVSVRSAAKDRTEAGAAEYESPEEDPKGSKLSVRSSPICTLGAIHL